MRVFFVFNDKTHTTAAFLNSIGKIDVNGADKDVLLSIPGIGEKLAERIIAYRREVGNFANLDDLKRVKGMTSYRYEKIKDYLYLKQ